MAKIQILNPNDQPIGKWRLINELRACLPAWFKYQIYAPMCCAAI
jgi:hypothetical protein